ncbi:biotin synthetase [Salmonella enterica subsp. arizonae]|uniref:Biotin synthetase n=1 Tax=Salmonella enterica subsp. arizonae TaxID=59203 RepID=A0A379TDI9_SALER|nr:biotin synthetase [Salmonella enterica subsp. arizonae]
MEVEQVLESARKAKNAGSTRFCMGAAWKNPRERDMPYLEQIVQGVKAMGLENMYDAWHVEREPGAASG